MASESCYRVARGLLLYGKQIRNEQMTRAQFMKKIDVKDGKFRAAGGDIGAVGKTPGLRFFESAREGISFGPGAGLVLGVSIGLQSLRAALVDANGELHCRKEAKPASDQLNAEPDVLLNRVQQTLSDVLDSAFQEDKLLVEGSLPLLGVSVAWPAPVARDKTTVGYALGDSGWRLGERLDNRVARHLHLEPARSHAINDAAAAAIGVAYLQTTNPDHIHQSSPRLAVVLRLAGGVGGSTIVVEDPEKDEGEGVTSGFPGSILTGGIDHLAGEIGHVPVSQELIDRLNEERKSLGKLKPLRCTCTPSSDPVPNHLEAFASAPALARRIDEDAAPADVASRVLADRKNKVHQQALNDIGTLTASALIGPVAILNPAAIVLTGALAVSEVAEKIEEGLGEAHVFGSVPEVKPLDAAENDYIRVKGAGLVVLRRKVFRRFSQLLGGSKVGVQHEVKRLVHSLPSNPW